MKVLLFDIDGTLIRSRGAGKAAISACLREEFGIAEPIVNVDFSGATDLLIARLVLTANAIALTTKTLERYRRGYLSRLAVLLPQSDSHVLPGVRELLARIKATADQSLGLVTGNLEAGARVKLEHHGLMDFFSYGGFGDVAEERAAIAQAAVTAAEGHHGRNLRREEILVIGDTSRDIACAHAVGVRCLAVMTGLVSREALASAGSDFLLEDLSDTAAIDHILAQIG